MKKIVHWCLFVMIVGLFVVPSLSAQDEPAEGLIDLDTLPLPSDGLENAHVELFTEEVITMEIDGEVDFVGADFLIIRGDEDQQVKLLVDAETVIYINEKKRTIEAVEEGAGVFAFYVNEGGLVKCDLLDVSQ